jgi:hypothetical protein
MVTWQGASVNNYEIKTTDNVTKHLGDRNYIRMANA